MGASRHCGPALSQLAVLSALAELQPRKAQRKSLL
jgi:hypothetical protein